MEAKSDSVMVASVQTRSPQVAVVARELALTFSESCARPQVVKHTPGVANTLADILCASLLRVPEVPIRPRTMDFYRSV